MARVSRSALLLLIVLVGGMLVTALAKEDYYSCALVNCVLHCQKCHALIALTHFYCCNAVLGVAKDAKGSKIKKAYRKLSLKYHPGTVLHTHTHTLVVHVAPLLLALALTLHCHGGGSQHEQTRTRAMRRQHASSRRWQRLTRC